VAARDADRLDAGAGGLGDPQPVQGQQPDQRMLSRRAEPGSHEQGAELVAVQGGGAGLAVQPRPADMHGRGVIQEFLLDDIPAEPGDGAQAAGDSGTCPATRFEVAGEALDVGPPAADQAR
jgi:hypothetical protein